MSGRPLPYRLCDVFTDRALTGNPLAVFTDARDLDTATMQALAREMNLSESTFVLPGDTDCDARIRIFTPAVELPFAGHPSIGAAWVLARAGTIGTGPVRQECAAGLVPVRVDDDGAGIDGGHPEVGADLDAAALAAAVGLGPGDIDGTGRPGAAAAGVPFGFLQVRDGAVARARPDADAICAATPGLVGLVLFSFDAGPGRAHVRMFAPGAGVPEDPGGGASAVALGVHLVDRGLLPPDGPSSFTISQGTEIGRPSALRVEVSAENARAVATAVSGAVVAVARGELLRLP